MANYQSTHTGAEIDAGIDLLDKNSATQGKVLTADGKGKASWENASGGKQLYLHSIEIQPNDRRYSVDFSFYSQRSEEYNSNLLYDALQPNTYFITGSILFEAENTRFFVFKIGASYVDSKFALRIYYLDADRMEQEEALDITTALSTDFVTTL